MNLAIGIIGLENTGKTALFRALTHGIQSSGRGNMATVPVPDDRLEVLANMVHPKKIAPTGIQVVDVGGVKGGAAESGGLGAQFLSNLQGIDALAVVVRFYQRSDLGFGPEAATPLDDLESILLELTLSDLSRVQKRLERATKAARSGDPSALREEDTLQKLQHALDGGMPARSVELSLTELEVIRDLGLLTLKPMIYVANVAEDDLGPALSAGMDDPNGVRPLLEQLEAAAADRQAELAVVSADTEAELGDLSEVDAREYLAAIGVTETGLNRFVHTAYGLLGWLTFFTAGEPEVKAWTVRKGAHAPEAAGRIHSDIERGFIRAEVTSWEDLIQAGSPEAAKRAGKTRLEGKEYVMQEGDVVYFRFNV